MQWVLIALVVLIVSVLVTILQRIITETVKGIIKYAPPSDAIIDQSMPKEIMEHIFSFMDPLTLMQSHNVSRYWRNHASKNGVKSIVLDTYVKSVQRQLPGIEEHWMVYNDHYPIDIRLCDISLAQKHGKQLLELKHQEIPFTYPLKDSAIDRYILKLPASVTVERSTEISFLAGNKYLSTVNSQLPPIVTDSGSAGHGLYLKFEVMMTLDEFILGKSPVNLIMLRNTKPQKRFGFIPLDNSFMLVIDWLAAPLIVHDVLYSEPFMNFIKPWFGVAGFIVLNGMITHESLNIIKYYPNQRNERLYKKLVIGTSIVATILFILLYPISSTHFTFIVIFVGTFFYVFGLLLYCFENKMIRPKDKLQLFLACTILGLLINDWPMLIRCIIDGVLWQRMLWNMIHFAVFSMYAIWIGVLSSVLHDRTRSWSWKYFINWEREVIKLVAGFFCSAIFVTLYAPYWQ